MSRELIREFCVAGEDELISTNVYLGSNGRAVTSRGEEESARRTVSTGVLPHVEQMYVASSLVKFFQRLFLPTDWPHGISEDYLRYQLFDSLQGLCSYISGVLANHKILQGLGIGRGAASVGAASASMVMRDAVGIISSLIFVAWKGNSFDSYAKQYRLLADCLNDVALLLDIAAPVIADLGQGYFLLWVCLAAAARAITGVAGNASRMALTQHFAKKRSAAADLASKEGTQETMVTLLGMCFGLILTQISERMPVIAFIAFFFLTIGHIAANISAMRVLHINRFNRHRLEDVLREFLRNATVLSISEEAKREKLYLSRNSVANVSLCPSLCELSESNGLALRKAVGTITLGGAYHDDSFYSSKHYWIIPSATKASFFGGTKIGRKHLVFVSAEADTQGDKTVLVKAYCVACLLSWKDENNTHLASKIKNIGSLDAFVADFLSKAENLGWDVSHSTALGEGPNRISTAYRSRNTSNSKKIL